MMQKLESCHWRVGYIVSSLGLFCGVEGQWALVRAALPVSSRLQLASAWLGQRFVGRRAPRHVQPVGCPCCQTRVQKSTEMRGRRNSRGKYQSIGSYLCAVFPPQAGASYEKPDGLKGPQHENRG